MTSSYSYTLATDNQKQNWENNSTVASKQIKYLRISVAKKKKKKQDLYAGNCKSLLGERREELTKWRDKLAFVGWKTQYLWGRQHSPHYNRYQNSEGLFCRRGTPALKFTQGGKGTRTGKTTLEKKDKGRGWTLTGSRTYYRARIIGTVALAPEVTHESRE